MNKIVWMVKLELPRGMKDFEAEETAGIEFVRKKFLQISQVYDFLFMDPSPIELLSVLETKSGPSIKDEIYHFKDKGDRNVALRFDFTMGLTRYAVSQKSIRLPAKVSAFGGVWRYDEPQKGRYRFFHQWDVEIYAKPTLDSEAEIIELTSRLFDDLGLKNITIDINHRSLVESYIFNIFGSNSPDVVDDLLRAVDKIQKKQRKEIITEYQSKGYDQESIESLLDFSEIKGIPEEIEEKFADVFDLNSWDYLKDLFSALKNRNVTNIRINFGIVRGLDYYSGTVFEVFDTTSDLGALAGGGRYDSLTNAFGRSDIGAAGVAGGVERIILTMKEQGIGLVPKVRLVSVVYVNDNMKGHAQKISAILRSHKIPTRIDLLGRPLKKQMESASDSSYAVIVAPSEFSENKVIIRNMEDGTEMQRNYDEFISEPKNFIDLGTPW